MPAKIFITSDRLQEARAYVVFLNRVFSAVKLGIEAERFVSPHATKAIQAEILKTQRQLEKIQSKIHQENQTCQRLQRKIDELNRWYCCNTQPELEKLGIEITRYRQAIGQAKARIHGLETEKQVAMIRLDAQQAQLTNALNGIHEQSMENDPRLVVAKTALQSAQNELKSMQSEADLKTMQ